MKAWFHQFFCQKREPHVSLIVSLRPRRREMLYDFLVDGVSSPTLKSSSFSQARTPICAASMSVGMHTSLKRILHPKAAIVSRVAHMHGLMG
jgi:hypothetical protein